MQNAIKNIKFVLFASLMIAMILPFSGMDTAQAQGQEQQQQKEGQTTKEKLSQLQQMRIDLEKTAQISQYSDNIENEDLDAKIERFGIVEELLNLRLYEEATNGENKFTQDYANYLIEGLEKQYDTKHSEEIEYSENPYESEEKDGIEKFHKTKASTSYFKTTDKKRFDCYYYKNTSGFNWGSLTSDNWYNTYIVGVQAFPDSIGVKKGTTCTNQKLEGSYIRFTDLTNVRSSCYAYLDGYNSVDQGMCSKFGLSTPVFITSQASYDGKHLYSILKGWDFKFVGR